MIKKELDRCQMICSDCGINGPSWKEGNFTQGKYAAKKKGWKMYWGKFRWMHRCPNCARAHEIKKLDALYAKNTK